MSGQGSVKNNNDIQPETQLIVDARLLDIGIPAPKPGVIYTISLMQYEVLKVIRGEYSHPSIFVGHQTPNLMGPEFRTGTDHRLQLTKEFPQYVSILDKYQTTISRTEPFFCLLFEVLDIFESS